MKLSYLFIIADIFICIGLIKYSYSIFLKLKDRTQQASNANESDNSVQIIKTVELEMNNYIFNLPAHVKRHIVSNEENLYVKLYGERKKDLERIPLRIMGPSQDVLIINNINENETLNRSLLSYSRNKTAPVVKPRTDRIQLMMKNRTREKLVGSH